MSRPILQQSIDGATGSEQGIGHSAKGHVSLGIFARTDGLDTVNDTLEVRLEVEGPDGEWSPLRDESGTLMGTLSADDFEDVDGDGTTYTAFTFVHGVPPPSVRANVTSLTDASGDDLSVDAWVLAANNSGTGSAYLSGSV